MNEPSAQAGPHPTPETQLVKVPPSRPPAVGSQLEPVPLLDLTDRPGSIMAGARQPFRPFIAGTLLGITLALGVAGVRSLFPQPIPFLVLRPYLRQSTLPVALALGRWRASLNDRQPGSQTSPSLAFQPTLPQPVMMDRFYLPGNLYRDSQGRPLDKAITVDRFYFTGGSEPLSLPQVPIAPASSLNLPPPPPPAQSILRVSSLPTTADPPQSSPILPPALPPQPPKTAATPTYKLLGVVQTNHFAAALFQTETNSYSVRPGETVGQSQFVLTGLRDGKAIVQQGDRQIVLQVGDSL